MDCTSARKGDRVLVAVLLLSVCVSVCVSGCKTTPGRDVIDDASNRDVVADVQADTTVAPDVHLDATSHDVDTTADLVWTDLVDVPVPTDVPPVDATDAVLPDDSGPDVDQDIPPVGCCHQQSDCQDMAVCVGGSPDLVGTCEAPPEPGRCWTESDCYTTQECIGIVTCPCGALCELPASPGTCSPLPSGCCNSDDDCNVDHVCRGQWVDSKMPGACVPSHLGPQCMGDSACCWNDDDCPGTSTCTGASTCGCIELCFVCGACMPDEMGYCN